MSRYIDAVALKKDIARLHVLNDEAEIRRAYEYNPHVTATDFEETLVSVFDAIDDAPSIDIVPRKAVKGYEGYYEVDMYGRVYSVERTVQVNDNGRIYDKIVKGRELSQADHTKGYKTVSLTKDGETKTVYVHRIVAEAYIPNPQNLPFINHKDEDKTNNFVTNLEWCTEQYNSTYGTAREKQANAIRGRKQSKEHKQKRSEAMKKYWAEKKEADDFCSYGERDKDTNVPNKRQTERSERWIKDVVIATTQNLTMTHILARCVSEAKSEKISGSQETGKTV